MEVIVPKRFQEVKAPKDHFGHFSTLKLIKGAALFLKEHLHRLEKAHNFLYKTPLLKGPIIEDIAQYCQGRDGVLKITLSRDQYFFSFRELPPKQNLILKKNSTPRKSLKYPNYVKPMEFEKNLNLFEDTYFLDENGFILETNIRNLFFLKGDKIIIPQNELIYEGVTISILKKIFPFELRPIKIGEIGGFDSAFACNSIRGVESVIGLSDHSFPCDEKISSLYNQFCSERLNES